jgi:hypothetical protein
MASILATRAGGAQAGAAVWASQALEGGGGMASLRLMAKPAKKPGKADRLRAALRENLKRRKTQAKGRSATETAQDDKPSTPAHDSAEFSADKQNR